MKKRILLVILAIALLASTILGLTACSNSGKGAGESTKGEVSAPAESDGDTIKNLQHQISDLQEEIRNLSNKIDYLQEQNKNLTGRIEELENKDKPVLDEAKAAEIKTAYYNLNKQHFVSEFYTYTAEDVTLTFYGEYNGAYVMFIDTPYLAYLDAITTQVVDGVTFVYGSSHTLDVYNNGSFYSVGEAFENGLLTHNDLVDINNRKNNKLYCIR